MTISMLSGDNWYPAITGSKAVIVNNPATVGGMRGSNCPVSQYCTTKYPYPICYELLFQPSLVTSINVMHIYEHIVFESFSPSTKKPPNYFHIRLQIVYKTLDYRSGLTTTVLQNSFDPQKETLLHGTTELLYSVYCYLSKLTLC